MRAIWFITFLTALSFSALATELTPDQQVAKTQGLVFYNQFKTTLAIPKLRIAADAGDQEAQYYLGEAIVRKSKYMTSEASAAYEASALQGNIYSMVRLSWNKNDLCVAMNNCPAGQKKPGEWRKIALEAAEQESSEGKAEAMYLMFRLTRDDKWLKKSAESGYAFAQYYLGTGYRDGKGFFLLPSSRSDLVEQLMKASAEGGYPPGMMAYVELLAAKKDYEAVRFWYQKAAESGYTEAVFGYGSYLAKNPSEIGFPYDPVKSYAIISTLLELDGGGGVKEFAKDLQAEIAPKLTSEQIAQATKMSVEWKKTHPPLSYFPDKL
ncbi:sel1 repeat family protein [Pseudomonas prosekii]|uniref:Sel1 repeat family protein n=1 Tax=Pseudomonas prosekii TaxID=1148509 RepID=A0A2U2CZZ8_9PSED|nr:sel1 repeat family protein [Pseudomonas prosekii]PWE38407.1 sel1 repeat family protein [Pseudomonas prosekii]PWE41235.1 sel1 repeat family protein [Pseudomonas prosekii]